MSLINLFAAARTAIANRLQRQRALDELMALDDRSLADIGIHRSQIPNLAMSFEQAAQIEAAPFAGHAMAFARSGGLAAGHR
jgi:uncharacterized protein YjiS (DUF1127 family)